jgi:hypothetical protein
MTDRTNTETSPGRFEFRVWGDDLNALAARVRDGLSGVTEVEGGERYLVTSRDAPANPKIRDDALDVKRLVQVRHGCEQWEPILKVPFPVTAATIETYVFDPIDLDPPKLDRDLYTAEQLSSEVVAPYPGFAAVDVSKARTIGTRAGCRAEVALVTIAGTVATMTVAFESDDLDAVVALRDAVGLADAVNESYPRAIRRILEMT